MSSFKFVHMRRLAELENELRLVEIEMEEHLETCTALEKNLVTEDYEAKVRLALWRVQEYAMVNHLRTHRCPATCT